MAEATEKGRELRCTSVSTGAAERASEGMPRSRRVAQRTAVWACHQLLRRGCHSMRR